MSAGEIVALEENTSKQILHELDVRVTEIIYGTHGVDPVL